MKQYRRRYVKDSDLTVEQVNYLMNKEKRYLEILHKCYNDIYDEHRVWLDAIIEYVEENGKDDIEALDAFKSDREALKALEDMKEILQGDTDLKLIRLFLGKW